VEYYETIPEEPLSGEPIGHVNLHGETCSCLGDYLHLLWIYPAGDLRTATVPVEARWAGVPQIFVAI
jgi:hypothetical protein